VKSLALAALALASIVSGLSYLWQKLALEGLPPATVILGRNVVAIACTLVFMRFRGGIAWRFDGRETVRLFLLGTLAYSAPLLIGIAGVQRSTAGNASILILLEPASILLFARFLLGEEVRRGQVLGVAAGLVGALCLTLETAPAGDLLSGEYRLGNALLAFHALLWGLYPAIAQPLVRKHRLADVVGFSVLFGLVLVLPVSLWELSSFEPGPELPRAIVWTVVLGVVVSFGTTFAWTFCLRHVPASATAPFAFLQPLTGVLAGALVLGERLSREAIVGGVLIGGGMLFVARSATKTRAEAEPADGVRDPLT